MGIEDAILWTLLNLTIVVALSVIIEVVSWGLISMSDCIAVNFDPACFSVHSNQPIDRDDPMWWPHANDHADDDDDGGG